LCGADSRCEDGRAGNDVCRAARLRRQIHTGSDNLEYDAMNVPTSFEEHFRRSLAASCRLPVTRCWAETPIPKPKSPFKHKRRTWPPCMCLSGHPCSSVVAPNRIPCTVNTWSCGRSRETPRFRQASLRVTLCVICIHLWLASTASGSCFLTRQPAAGRTIPDFRRKTTI
jgi:hypothetical protein